MRLRAVQSEHQSRQDRINRLLATVEKDSSSSSSVAASSTSAVRPLESSACGEHGGEGEAAEDQEEAAEVRVAWNGSGVGDGVEAVEKKGVAAQEALWARKTVGADVDMPPTSPTRAAAAAVSERR